MTAGPNDLKNWDDERMIATLYTSRPESFDWMVGDRLANLIIERDDCRRRALNAEQQLTELKKQLTSSYVLEIHTEWLRKQVNEISLTFVNSRSKL